MTAIGEHYVNKISEAQKDNSCSHLYVGAFKEWISEVENKTVVTAA
jgi:hypothetical protein